MRRALAIAVVAIVVIVAAGLAFLFWPRGDQSAAVAGSRLGAQDFAQVEQGRYLARAGDCESCHDDPDTHAPFAGGRPIETPFGMVKGANITPDATTGIGRWSDAQFIAALTKGEGPHGKLLYPAMPYPYYARLSQDDALAMRAYLNTVKPVKHAVVSNQLPFPFDIRQIMVAWNALYYRDGAYVADPSKSGVWNRGAYLVLGPGHCAACHTPKSWLGGDETSRALQGGNLQGWFAPDINGDPDAGLGRWTNEDIVAYLKTGHNPKTAAAGTMGETIAFSTSRLTDDDLTAMATYLKSLPGPANDATALAASDARMQAGAAIYADQCSACHSANGEGVADLFPALADSSNVAASDPTSLIRILLEGARGVSTAKEPTSAAMPSFRWKLNDEDAADVLTYIRNSWGHAAAPVAVSAVKAARRARHATP